MWELFVCGNLIVAVMSQGSDGLGYRDAGLSSLHAGLISAAHLTVPVSSFSFHRPQIICQHFHFKLCIYSYTCLYSTSDIYCIMMCSQEANFSRKSG